MQNKNRYEEEEQIRRLFKGDESAFKAVFIKYGGRLQQYALKLTRSKEIAEDIVHDVFLNIWKNRENLGHIANFDSYLFTAAHHNLHRAFRRRAKETLIVSELKQRSAQQMEAEGESRIVNSEVRAAIREAVNKLTPQQRRIFLLSREHGLSHEEIATKLGITRRTVSNTISEALRMIREYMNLNYGSNASALMILSGLF